MEIENQAAGLKFEDWADYVGYDRRPSSELVAEMENHLHRLISALGSAEFRLLTGRTWLRRSDECGWRVDGEWTEISYGDT